MSRQAGRAGRLVFTGLLAAACAFGRPRDAGAQGVPAAYGLLAGTAAGAYVTTGIFVAKARAGSYLYSLDDAIAPRWELIPLVAMPVGSFFVGLDDGQRLANSFVWGSAGFASGAVVGLGVAALLSESDEGLWSGAIIGSAAGLLAGSIYGAIAYDGDTNDAASGGAVPAVLSFRIRL